MVEEVITQSCKACGTKWTAEEPLPCPKCFPNDKPKPRAFAQLDKCTADVIAKGTGILKVKADGITEHIPLESTLEPAAAEGVRERAMMAEHKADCLERELNLAKQDADSWRRTHRTSQDGANDLIGLLEAERDRYKAALEQIALVDMPSASDKTAWIVMLESIVSLAKKALAGES